MPVELPETDSIDSDPIPPRRLVWFGLFIVVEIGGCAASIIEWPSNEPIYSAWFWCRSFVIPALFWCALYGLRLHYFDDESARIHAEREEKRILRENALRFASEPLAVLDWSYLTALGNSGLASKIVGGESALRARTTRGGDTGVRHTALKLDGKPTIEFLHAECFRKVLDELSETISQIPNDIPLIAYLDVAPSLDKAILLESWEACWEMARLRTIRTEFLTDGEGVMAIDRWLDIAGGTALEKLALFISVQLHEQTMNDTGEAVVALLLGWAPLVERRGIEAVAKVHRPVEGHLTELSNSVSKSILWGKSKASAIEDVWQAALLEEDKASFLQCSTTLQLGFIETPELSGVHDVDSALGRCGAAAGWLNLVLAAEHAALNEKPQLTISRGSGLWACLVSPSLAQIGSRKIG